MYESILKHHVFPKSSACTKLEAGRCWQILLYTSAVCVRVCVYEVEPAMNYLSRRRDVSCFLECLFLPLRLLVSSPPALLAGSNWLICNLPGDIYNAQNQHRVHVQCLNTDSSHVFLSLTNVYNLWNLWIMNKLAVCFTSRSSFPPTTYSVYHL